ncbi:MAG: PhoPQ-activated pathogenicity-related family protein [Planctomycetaceae bacterium]|jgi:PhoPQ-activated pathogenicity-related protein|nr:PhoPQ-activated pathogenicity-related family protein [Planctomycetaceae bacterium]
MKKTISLSFLFLLLTTVLIAQDKIAPTDILQNYVNAKDDSFTWRVVNDIDVPVPGVKLSLLEVTSQIWHDVTWKHFMLIATPAKIAYDNYAVLVIGGGTNGNEPGNKNEFLVISTLAMQSQVPIMVLYQVPNQPLDPNNKGEGFREDALIGETILKATETNDPTWLLLLPMTKSVIKSLDVAQAYFKEKNNRKVNKFVVGGASKRGWTTWLTGATRDPRVVGLVPIVYNNLDIEEQLAYHIESWGNYSSRIHDYTDRSIFQKDKPMTAFQSTAIKIVDPYSYLAKIDIPKLLIHGSNDPYWTVDATKLYWDKIREPKFLLTIPNMGHATPSGESLTKVLSTVAIFCRYIASDNPFPTVEWKLEDNENEYKVTINSEIPNTKKTLWQAYSETNHFEDSKFEPTKQGDTNTIKVSKPQTGHTAFFVELTGEHEGAVLSITTEVWRF